MSAPTSHHGNGSAPRRVLIAGGTAIDCTGAPPRPRCSLLIDGERIAALGAEADQLVAQQPADLTLDAAGKTVMPGLIDGHCHMTYGETYGQGEQDLVPGVEYRTLIAAWNAQKVLRAGVTTIADPGGSYFIGVAVRNAINAGLFDGPRIVAAGRFLNTYLGAADFLPSYLGSPESATGVLVNTRDEMVKEVRHQIKNGVDFIKIGDSFFGDVQCFSFEEMKAIVDEAHRLRRRVTIHARGASAVVDAVKAGVDWIMHGDFMQEADVEALAASGKPLCPTLTLSFNMIDYGDEVGAVRPIRDGFSRMLESTVRALELARQYGVTMVAGTDSGFAITPYGHWHAREMELLVKHVGYTPMEALLAGTRNAACALAMSERVGTLEPGKLADVLVVDGDPLVDIRLLQDKQRLTTILKGGRVVDTTAPWPERRIYPTERIQAMVARPLFYEDAIGQ
jgi:imidazolonepropionase-like amidohydrolase